jgi:translation initiation factor 1
VSGNKNKGRNLVWSDQRGGDVRGNDAAAPRRARGDGVVRVRRETKGRGGKTVTAVSGVELANDGLRELAKDLKQRCGTGGAVKDGVIEIQGDHRTTIVAALEARGYEVKLAGG